jgi:hypothetical protein
MVLLISWNYLLMVLFSLKIWKSTCSLSWIDSQSC